METESKFYNTARDPRWETSEIKLKEIPITVRRNWETSLIAEVL